MLLHPHRRDVVFERVVLGSLDLLVTEDDLAHRGQHALGHVHARGFHLGPGVVEVQQPWDRREGHGHRGPVAGRIPGEALDLCDAGREAAADDRGPARRLVEGDLQLAFGAGLAPVRDVCRESPGVVEQLGPNQRLAGCEVERHGRGARVERDDLVEKGIRQYSRRANRGGERGRGAGIGGERHRPRHVRELPPQETAHAIRGFVPHGHCTHHEGRLGIVSRQASLEAFDPGGGSGVVADREGVDVGRQALGIEDRPPLE
jgi:hypothetical protein